MLNSQIKAAEKHLAQVSMAIENDVNKNIRTLKKTTNALGTTISTFEEKQASKGDTLTTQLKELDQKYSQGFE